MAGVVSVACAGIAVGAQSSTDPQQNPTQAEPTTGMDQPSTTLVGCVYREDDVAGRSPNIAEQAGVMEDYILADAQPASSSSSSGATGTSGSATSSAGADAKMYKLEKISDDRLSSLVGKRVEVTGRADAEAGDQATGTTGAPAEDKNVSPDRIELPEFEVETIREVAGTCPPKPASQK
jgi:hypothetical protein